MSIFVAGGVGVLLTLLEFQVIVQVSFLDFVSFFLWLICLDVALFGCTDHQSLCSVFIAHPAESDRGYKRKVVRFFVFVAPSRSNSPIRLARLEFLGDMLRWCCLVFQPLLLL